MGMSLNLVLFSSVLDCNHSRKTGFKLHQYHIFLVDKDKGCETWRCVYSFNVMSPSLFSLTFSHPTLLALSSHSF